MCAYDNHRSGSTQTSSSITSEVGRRVKRYSRSTGNVTQRPGRVTRPGGGGGWDGAGGGGGGKLSPGVSLPPAAQKLPPSRICKSFSLCTYTRGTCNMRYIVLTDRSSGRRGRGVKLGGRERFGSSLGKLLLDVDSPSWKLRLLCFTLCSPRPPPRLLFARPSAPETVLGKPRSGSSGSPPV